MKLADYFTYPIIPWLNYLVIIKVPFSIDAADFVPPIGVMIDLETRSEKYYDSAISGWHICLAGLRIDML